MNLARAILRAANALVSLAVAVCLTVSGAYACYALWDNQQVYSAAENVQLEMQKLKPKVEQTTDQADAPAEPAPPSFDELLAVNEDVCAWLTIDNTKIDYPVLQGETNLDYINTDELLEVTPHHLRLRKKILDQRLRKRAAFAKK